MDTPVAEPQAKSKSPTMYEEVHRRAQIGGANPRTVALIDFGDVIKGLKNGRCYSRIGWNRPGQFIFRVAGSKFSVNRPPLTQHVRPGTVIDYASHIDIKTLNGVVSVWNPSQRDMEADDWFEVAGEFDGGAA